MENPKFRGPRKELADKLREIRQSNPENPDLAKEKAKGYLEANQDSNEYQKEKSTHQKEEKEKKFDKEEAYFKEHGIVWLMECSKDGGEALKQFQARKERIIKLGLPIYFDGDWLGGRSFDVNGYNLEEKQLDGYLQYFFKERADMYKLDQLNYAVQGEARGLSGEYYSALKSFDWKKLKAEHPSLFELRLYSDGSFPAPRGFEVVMYRDLRPNYYIDSSRNEFYAFIQQFRKTSEERRKEQEDKQPLKRGFFS